MVQESISAKASRTYRSELRRRQAEETRLRVVAAAAELFAADGYARTTLAKIAAAAGVSVETVQGQGPKAALMIAAAEYGAVGVAGEENILNLEVGRDLLAVDDPEKAIALIVATQVEVHGRTARLALAFNGGANSDPELDRYLNDLSASINRQVRRVLDAYRDRGWLRDDVSFDDLIETAAVIVSVETYLRIVHRDGWSADAYAAWSRRMLAETVFRPALA